MIIPTTVAIDGSGSVRVHVGAAKPPSVADWSPDLSVPSTYPGTDTPVPAALHRRLHLPTLQVGQGCPTSTGTPVGYPGFNGTALGAGAVRVIIAN